MARKKKHLDPEVERMFEEAIAMSALEKQFDNADRPPTLGMITAAEWVLTGACASIELAEQPDSFSVETPDERAPHDSEKEERDCLSRRAVEKMLTNVRIESAVITGDGKLLLLIELRAEEDPGHVAAR